MKRLIYFMHKRDLLAVGAAIVIAMVVVMFFPMTGTAGSSSAPSLPILDNIQPAWSQKLPAAKRFEVVLDGEAVLDKETGLVWEKSPTYLYLYPWSEAFWRCAQKKVGGRYGWHLPTIEQLQSLVDPAVNVPGTAPGVSLPPGHPFTNVQLWDYWSATTSPLDANSAYCVNFDEGHTPQAGKELNFYIWCVRGGQTYDSH